MKNQIYKKYKILTDYPPYENLEFREDNWKNWNEVEDPIFDEDRALSYYYKALKTADFEFEEEEESEHKIWLKVEIYHEDYKYEDEPIYSYIMEKTKITKNEDITIVEDKKISFIFIKREDINKANFASAQFKEVQLFNDNGQLEDYFFIAHEELKNFKNIHKYEILY